jgi:hypothetical protein
MLIRSSIADMLFVGETDYNGVWEPALVVEYYPFETNIWQWTIEDYGKS